MTALFEGTIMAAILKSVYHLHVSLCLDVAHGKQFQPNVVFVRLRTHITYATQSISKLCFVITGGDARIHRVSIDQRPIDTVFPTDSIVSPCNYDQHATGPSFRFQRKFWKKLSICLESNFCALMAAVSANFRDEIRTVIEKIMAESF